MAEHQDASQQTGDNGKRDIPHPEWTKGDATRAGRTPKGFKLQNLEFGGKNAAGSPMLESIGLESLIGATAFESANLKANHIEPGVLTGMLADTMAKLEEKYHSGAYDAAAMPLVEQYLKEMRHMASLQLERYEIVAERVLDIKEANEAAYKAVQDVREQREAEIRESSEYIQDEIRIAKFRRSERRRVRQESRDNRKLMKELNRTDKLAIKRQRQALKDEEQVILDEGKTKESAMQEMQREYSGRTRLAQEEQRAAEAQAAAKQAELAGAKAAAEAAEANLARARTEIVERTIRERQEATLEEMRISIDEAMRLYEEQINQAKNEADEYIRQARELADAQAEAEESKKAAQQASEQPARQSWFSAIAQRFSGSKPSDQITDDQNPPTETNSSEDAINDGQLLDQENVDADIDPEQFVLDLKENDFDDATETNPPIAQGEGSTIEIIEIEDRAGQDESSSEAIAETEHQEPASAD